MKLYDLIERYILEIGTIKPIGTTHFYGLRRLQRELGHKNAAKLVAADIIAHCRKRINEGAKPATVALDVSFLRGPLSYATEGFGLTGVSTSSIDAAMPILKKYGLIAMSRPRSVRPGQGELDSLIAYFKASECAMPMADIIEFQVHSARRIGETCRLLFSDVDTINRTCVVRDMKDPRHKIGNDHEFPLLGKAWEIVAARMQNWNGHEEARIFPYSARSVSAAFTRAKDELGFGHLHLHDLRREAASRLLEAGYSVAQTQTVTGHKDPSMLLRVYTKIPAKDIHNGPTNAPAGR